MNYQNSESVYHACESQLSLSTYAMVHFCNAIFQILSVKHDTVSNECIPHCRMDALMHLATRHLDNYLSNVLMSATDVPVLAAYFPL